jgi:hypothetical protein
MKITHISDTRIRVELDNFGVYLNKFLPSLTTDRNRPWYVVTFGRNFATVDECINFLKDVDKHYFDDCELLCEDADGNQMLSGQADRVNHALQHICQNTNMHMEDFAFSVAKWFRGADPNTAQSFIEFMEKERELYDSNYAARDTFI